MSILFFYLHESLFITHNAIIFNYYCFIQDIAYVSDSIGQVIMMMEHVCVNGLALSSPFQSSKGAALGQAYIALR